MAAKRGQDRYSIVSVKHVVLATGLDKVEAEMLQAEIPGSTIHNDGPKARYV